MRNEEKKSAKRETKTYKINKTIELGLHFSMRVTQFFCAMVFEIFVPDRALQKQNQEVYKFCKLNEEKNSEEKSEFAISFEKDAKRREMKRKFRQKGEFAIFFVIFVPAAR